ncbi:MAG: PEP-CTERM sorting domain-containing protein [bacterium]|nr:PEP-CTERM sorting domain-containing protein [bacterium]
MKNTLLVMGLLAVAAVPAGAAVVATTTHGPASTSLDGSMASGDLIAGMIATELPGDLGWHPANTNPADQLAAFTDGAGILGSGLTGLLNDNGPAGAPVKLVMYDLGGPTDVTGINIFTGNNGLDGRVFSTTTVYSSTDGGTNYNLLGYFQSDPSGTINSGGPWGSTLVSISDDANPVLLSGVTNLEFDFFSVDNTQGQMRDPFDGINPFTGVDDGLTSAFVSPLVFEIDVLPEPTSLSLLVLGGLAVLRRRR